MQWMNFTQPHPHYLCSPSLLTGIHWAKCPSYNPSFLLRVQPPGHAIMINPPFTNKKARWVGQVQDFSAR